MGSGSARWMSPELLIPPADQDGLHTKESDVWAFGMTAYVRHQSHNSPQLTITIEKKFLLQELLTGKQPYHEFRFDAQVIATIIVGKLPQRPAEFKIWPIHYRETWSLCEVCWSKAPSRSESTPSRRTRFQPKIGNVRLTRSGS